jgi:ubiquinone/menaquinone biosynthesis C-methylase UbiE
MNEFNKKAMATWSSGDYPSIAAFIPPISAHLVRLVNISPDKSVLDVACGNGNTAITARRMGARVTGIDLTSELLDKAVEEEMIAEIDGIEWKQGDVEDLPFEDESFDTVLSTFGHMFAPHPELAIKEILRVTKRGGSVGFATWPPELAVGSMFRIISKYTSTSVPNPLPSPMEWGIPEVVRKRLGGEVNEIYFERGTVNVHILSPNHYWIHFSTKYGPLIQAIRVVNEQSEEKVELLRKDFLKAIKPYIYENELRVGYLLTIGKKA